MSGRGILPIALKCIREIREAVDVPLIGCGGITDADDVRAFQNEGASVIGVGSALTGLSSDGVADYFSTLEQVLTGPEAGNNQAPETVDMGFEAYELVSNERVCEDIVILTFDKPIDIQGGEFVHVWIPGLGEKPFSALTDDPFSLVVIDVGVFTHELMTLQPGALVYVRGPHGNAVMHGPDARVVGS